jgi:hypothetical protein
MLRNVLVQHVEEASCHGQDDNVGLRHRRRYGRRKFGERIAREHYISPMKVPIIQENSVFLINTHGAGQFLRNLLSMRKTLKDACCGSNPGRMA